MDRIGIEIGRVWDNADDDGWLLANDGNSRGKVRTDWELSGKDHLIKMGEALKRFPENIPGQYLHEIRIKDDLPHLIFHARADNPKQILLGVTMKSTRTNKLLPPDADYPPEFDIFAPGRLSTELVKSQTNNELEGECTISFAVDPSGVHRLGELLLRFSERERGIGLFKYRMVRWSPNPDGDSLIEWEHPQPEHSEIDPAFAEWERLKKKHPAPKEKERKKGWTFGREADERNADWRNFPT
jgi:hypothetical protein